MARDKTRIAASALPRFAPSTHSATGNPLGRMGGSKCGKRCSHRIRLHCVPPPAASGRPASGGAPAPCPACFAPRKCPRHSRAWASLRKLRARWPGPGCGWASAAAHKTRLAPVTPPRVSPARVSAAPSALCLAALVAARVAPVALPPWAGTRRHIPGAWWLRSFLPGHRRKPAPPATPPSAAVLFLSSQCPQRCRREPPREPRHRQRKPRAPSDRAAQPSPFCSHKRPRVVSTFLWTPVDTCVIIESNRPRTGLK